jgi:hypothetical protein
MSRLPFPNGQVRECIFNPQAVTTPFDIIHQNAFPLLLPFSGLSTYHSRSSFLIDECPRFRDRVKRSLTIRTRIIYEASVYLTLYI